MPDRSDINGPVAAAIAVLGTPSPAEKCAAAKKAVSFLETPAQRRSQGRQPAIPDRPARPPLPRLAPASDVPRRGLGSEKGRIALLHAIAHIEFNAIDLAFDMAARFHREIAADGLDEAAFIADWTHVGAEESLHFQLVEARLADYGAKYGDLPAHDGLWEAASKTAHDVLGRLVVAPMILEARGLDVTPGMIASLRQVGDEKSASALAVIYQDEIGHVACGKKWFDALCAARNLHQETTFHARKREFFGGALKPPFNHQAREQAGMNASLYEPD